MKVFVAGGTGAVGRYAVPALVGAGHTVIAIARSTEKAQWLRDQGAKPVQASLFDRDALARTFEGQDAVINLATAIPAGSNFLRSDLFDENDRIRREGTKAVVDAALKVGVPRVLQESVVMIYRGNGSGWIDEDWRVDRFPMALGNLAAEANAARFSGSGGVGVVLRFGWFYGPTSTHSQQFLRLARRHVCIQMGRADSYVSSIHLADAGSAVVAALNVPSGTYNIVDNAPLTKREYADAIARAAGKKVWLYAPGPAAHLLGDQLTSLTRSLRVSNMRFRAATGWNPVFDDAGKGWLATATALRVSDSS
jgi:nucleoside-diphosphate-sugar epimerase